MKHTFIWIAVVAAASGAALAVACSSSSDDSGTTNTADSGTSGASGTSGKPVVDSGTSGTSGLDPTKDTCTKAAADNTCQCSCGVTGQVEDKTLHCPQPSQDTGQCTKVCCTGPYDASTSGGTSGTSGSSGDSGIQDAAGD